ncbi:MAG TPA: hypothetical protein VK489_06270 [Ferruginibacter sp.]|nr:hypothetical protein [Ferruginibacter sp.]
MNIKITLAAMALFFIGLSAASAQTVSITDLKKLEGCWWGTLTYLDYTPGKPYTMPADLEIRQLGESNQLYVSNTYPNEPKANSADTIILSPDGRMLNDETIKLIRKPVQGTLLIVTQKEGVDGKDNRPAIFRYTYDIGSSFYNLKKEVQFTGTKEWIKRHEYNYKRKDCN